jgi:hypothetical protein
MTQINSQDLMILNLNRQQLYLNFDRNLPLIIHFKIELHFILFKNYIKINFIISLLFL